MRATTFVRPRCDRTLQLGVMSSQSPGTPTETISGLQLRSPGKKGHLDAASAVSYRVYYKGEGGGFPQVRAMVNLVCPCCPWLVLAPRVLQLCTNHFVWVVCRLVWVSEACQLFLVPSRSSNTPPLPLKVLWAKERAPTPSSSVVSYLGPHLGPFKSWGCVISGLTTNRNSIVPSSRALGEDHHLHKNKGGGGFNPLGAPPRERNITKGSSRTWGRTQGRQNPLGKKWSTNTTKKERGGLSHQK